DLGGQLDLPRLVGPVLAAGEEPDEGPALLGPVIADGAPQHRVLGLQRVEHRAEGGRALKLDFRLTAGVCKPLYMRGEHYADHSSVWTSTESTRGRSSTLGVQVLPSSAEA